MQLFDRKVELSILRAYTANNLKATAQITQSIDEACFHTTLGKEIYSRVNTIATERGIMLSWEDLKSDIALSEDTRNYIKSYKRKPILKIDMLNQRINTLQTLRKARSMVYVANQITKDLIERDNADVDKLYDKVVDMVTDAKGNASSSNWFTHIGHKDKTAFNKLLKQVLKTQKNRYIPTGIEAFDSVNRGIPRGTNMTIAAESGWGKSVMAGMLAGSIAKKGAKVGLVSLEMNDFEVLQRQVSNIGDVDMTDLLDPEGRIDAEQLKRVNKIMRKWDRRIEDAGGLLSIIVPNTDVTIKDIFFALKPFKYDVIIIDYVGLLKGTDSDDQVRALGKIGRQSKIYAGSTNSIVINCAQLNDEGKVKYSRALTEHSSLLWQWRTTEETKETKICKVEQPKARGLSPHDFYLKANFSKMRFEKVDAYETPSAANENKTTIKTSTNKANISSHKRSQGKSGSGKRDKKRATGFKSNNNSKIYDLTG